MDADAWREYRAFLADSRELESHGEDWSIQRWNEIDFDKHIREYFEDLKKPKKNYELDIHPGKIRGVKCLVVDLKEKKERK